MKEEHDCLENWRYDTLEKHVIAQTEIIRILLKRLGLEVYTKPATPEQIQLKKVKNGK